MIMKICFLHPIVHDINSMLNYLCLNDSDIKESLTWDEINPDVVIASEHIYLSPKFFSVFKRLYSSGDRLFIFHGGEVIYPDLNVFDYALAYCTYLKEFDRVIKIPEQLFFFREKAGVENDYNIGTAKESLKKREFCSFIYSNAFAHPSRDSFFYVLSNYKKVSSLGAHLNNTKTTPSGGDINWLEESIRLKGNYKFAIAFENAFFYGGTTEKLLSSFRAHTVPIYWGNPNVSDFYNPAAFINCHDYNSFEEVVQRIKEIDSDDELWSSMVSQPWQTQEQKDKTKEVTEIYGNFMSGLLKAQDISAYRKRPSGTHTNNYYRWFFRNFAEMRLMSRIIHKLKYLKNKRGSYK